MTSVYKWQTRVTLQHDWPVRANRVLVEHGNLSASVFRYSSGVMAVRLQHQSADVIVLPFQGQQIWRAQFHDRELAMHSMFDEPLDTQDFLRTYGALLVHCGATAMGPPGPEDTHPPHGELPNAHYNEAQIILGSDERGHYIGVTGRYRHTIGFNTNYDAIPEMRLYDEETCCVVSLDIKNLKNTSMDLMYLAHINLRPIDHAELHYTAIKSPAHVRVRADVPSHVVTGPGYTEFLDSLKAHPEIHHHLSPGLLYAPEVVFLIDYLADENGEAWSLQRHPDGSGDFVCHQPAQLPHCARWLSRTPDQDCFGLALPATAEVAGLAREKAKGNVLCLAGQANFHCDYEFGYLDKTAAGALQAKISGLCNTALDDNHATR